jgi:hypothetical protein
LTLQQIFCWHSGSNRGDTRGSHSGGATYASCHYRSCRYLIRVLRTPSGPLSAEALFHLNLRSEHRVHIRPDSFRLSSAAFAARISSRMSVLRCQVKSCMCPCAPLARALPLINHRGANAECYRPKALDSWEDTEGR